MLCYKVKKLNTVIFRRRSDLYFVKKLKTMPDAQWANEELEDYQEFQQYSYESDDPNYRPSQDKLNLIRALAKNCMDLGFLL